jgi:hypothetical protein
MGDDRFTSPDRRGQVGPLEQGGHVGQIGCGIVRFADRLPGVLERVDEIEGERYGPCL